MSKESEAYEGKTDKIILNKIKKLDPWSIIDVYFRDNPSYKTQHQLDSYNEFIGSKMNGIQYIIQRENPQLIYKDPINADKGIYRYQISIYYGELFDNDKVNSSIKDDILPKYNEENIFLTSPTIYDIDSYPE